MSTNSSSASTDYAFEMACSNIRYGPGVTKEVGQDMINLRAKKVGVFTDSNLVNLPPVKTVLDSLAKNQVNYVVYDKVRVEPTDESFWAAAEFAKKEGLDCFLAVGGGSVIDTAKAANLYSSDPSAEFLDYVNAPIGAGKPVMCDLKPLVAVPTTSGTGSETTGVAVFDYEPLQERSGCNSSLQPRQGSPAELSVLSWASWTRSTLATCRSAWRPTRALMFSATPWSPSQLSSTTRDLPVQQPRT